MVGDLLAASSGNARNAMVAHVLATCASYCYADLDTVALMLTRLGMDGGGCVRVQQSVDAMYIFSTAYVLQSRCGRVVILCYRGTEPTNLGSWLGDADAGTEPLMATSTRSETLAVHRGFYRNFRATHWQVLQELAHASNGRRLADPNEKVDHPLEALYVTGHSLGGAMAILFALTTEFERLRGVYTFGQPMVVAGAVSASTAAVDSKIVRHVLMGDPVPALPPAAWGAYAHIGREYRYSAGEWVLAPEATGPMPNLREIPRSVLALFSGGWRRKSPRKAGRYAIDAHAPHRYLDVLRPPDRLTEFGD
jgi:hypothetical protein